MVLRLIITLVAHTAKRHHCQSNYDATTADQKLLTLPLTLRESAQSSSNNILRQNLPISAQFVLVVMAALCNRAGHYIFAL